MPLGLLLLVALTAAIGGYWSWHFQRRALDLLSPNRAVNQAANHRSPAAGTAAATAAPAGPAPILPGAGTERIALEQRERTAASVLGWVQFSVVSVVVLDGMAIVACRSREPELARRPRRRFLRLRAARAGSQWPMLLTTDQTLVLLMGEDAQAHRARALLERWRRSAAVLWLRPTAVAGGIEFYDGCGSALRAMLLAD